MRRSRPGAAAGPTPPPQLRPTSVRASSSSCPVGSVRAPRGGAARRAALARPWRGARAGARLSAAEAHVVWVNRGQPGGITRAASSPAQRRERRSGRWRVAARPGAVRKGTVRHPVGPDPRCTAGTGCDEHRAGRGFDPARAAPRLRPAAPSERRAPRGATTKRGDTRCTCTSSGSQHPPSRSCARQRSSCSTLAARRDSRPHGPSGRPRGRPLETRSRPPALRPAALLADVAKREYAPASEAGGYGHEGSTPSVRIDLSWRRSESVGASARAKDRRRHVRWQGSTPIPSSPFEPMSKRRRGCPSETGVKRGSRSVKGGEKELLERLGNNDLCPCGSGRRFQELLSQ